MLVRAVPSIQRKPAPSNIRARRLVFEDPVATSQSRYARAQSDTASTGIIQPLPASVHAHVTNRTSHFAGLGVEILSDTPQLDTFGAIQFSALSQRGSCVVLTENDRGCSDYENGDVDNWDGDNSVHLTSLRRACQATLTLPEGPSVASTLHESRAATKRKCSLLVPSVSLPPRAPQFVLSSPVLDAGASCVAPYRTDSTLWGLTLRRLHAAVMRSSVLVHGALLAMGRLTRYLHSRNTGESANDSTRGESSQSRRGTTFGLFADRYRRRGGALHALYWYNVTVIAVCAALILVAFTAEIWWSLSVGSVMSGFFRWQSRECVFSVAGMLSSSPWLCDNPIPQADAQRTGINAESVLWQSLFWVRTLYGLSAVPFLVFKIPFVARLYLTSHATGYDRLGNTVPQLIALRRHTHDGAVT
jgi:hypothetical protein